MSTCFDADSTKVVAQWKSLTSDERVIRLTPFNGMLSQIGIKLVPLMLQQITLKNTFPLLKLNCLIATTLSINMLLSKLVILEAMEVFNFKVLMKEKNRHDESKCTAE